MLQTCKTVQEFLFQPREASSDLQIARGTADQEILLQGEAGVGETGDGGVIVDHANLVHTVHQLARRADCLGCAGDDEAE